MMILQYHLSIPLFRDRTIGNGNGDKGISDDGRSNKPIQCRHLIPALNA